MPSSDQTTERPDRRVMSDLDYPADLRYTSDHEWVRVREDGVVRIGITSFAQDALGDVVYVSLPAVGDSVTPGDSCGEVESTKSVSDVLAPLDGEVTATNAALDDAPELINSDPYGEGWMFEMRPADPASVDSLMDAETYTASLS
jgi:glycine cleavage system H protein